MTATTTSMLPEKKPVNNVPIPIALPIIALVLVVIAALLRPGIESQSDEWKNINALGTGIPFILEFVAIVLTFIFLIFVAAKLLNNRISAGVYTIIERIILACVFLGIIGMFQPWALFELLNKPVEGDAGLYTSIYGGLKNIYDGLKATDVAGAIFQLGFDLLLFAFIAFNVWSHITPRRKASTQVAAE
ncbi:MAG: hypothetical protein U0528_07880 [Anaerolineae bacterium]|nr:hypothetical protein [Anaerolineae bacterium]